MPYNMRAMIESILKINRKYEIIFVINYAVLQWISIISWKYFWKQKLSILYKKSRNFLVYIWSKANMIFAPFPVYLKIIFNYKIIYTVNLL